MNRIFLFLVLIMVAGCNDNGPTEVGQVEGLKPIYISEEENVVKVVEARSFENLGKIVYAAPYILVNERYKGIHLVYNSDPTNPIKLNFIQIPGNTDFTIKGQYLYANHGSDLKTFLIGSQESSTTGNEFNDLQETQIITNLFSEDQNNQISALFPPDYEGFFECVDPDAGIVIGWDSATLFNPECRI